MQSKNTASGARRAGTDRGPAGDAKARLAELRALHRARRIPRYRSLLLHWLGRWFRRVEKTRLATLPEVGAGQVGVCFAGHATAVIKYVDLTIVCDPMLGNWVKGAKREVAAGLAAESLDQVDLVLISHGHADHLHVPTLAKLPRSATVIMPPRTAHLISELGFARVVELGVAQSVQHRSVDLATAPVRHRGLEGAPAMSYVIRGNGPSVFFCGDSGYFPGFADIGRRYQPDIALLPIGGYLPLSFRTRHMSPLDAIYAFEDLKARVMIPIHYGAFALSYERLHDPSRWLAELVRQHQLEPFVVELAPGESRVFVPPRRTRKRSQGDSHSARGADGAAGGDEDFEPDTAEGPGDAAAA